MGFSVTVTVTWGDMSDTADMEWMEEKESEPEKWFSTKAQTTGWLGSNHSDPVQEDGEVQWLESTKDPGGGGGGGEDENEVEWLGSTKKTSPSNSNGFLASTKESHMGPQWFEASVEDLGQLEIFDLPPALNVHVEVTGELQIQIQIQIQDNTN